MIDYWLLIFFNLFFTSAPPIMFGIMDSDLSAEMLLGVPELYRTGQGSGVSDSVSCNSTTNNYGPLLAF